MARFEEKDGNVLIRFESFGPKIKDHEKEKIFEQHFRGEHAQASERGGSGIGLYAAKTLSEAQYGGNIYVNQLNETLWVDGNTLYKTRFTLVLPILDDEDQRQKNRQARNRRGRFRQ